MALEEEVATPDKAEVKVSKKFPRGYFVEFLGIFIFLYVNAAIPIAIFVILAIIYFSGKISFLLFMKNKLSSTKFMGYVIMELLGAYAAYHLYMYTQGGASLSRAAAHSLVKLRSSNGN